MKLGVSTASFYPLETEIALEKIAKSGVKYTEIFYNSEAERKPSFTKKLLNIRDEYGIQISALHPMASFGEPYTIFSDYARRFDEARENFLRYFETAAQVGAKYINLHGDKLNGKLSVEEYCERFGVLAQDANSFGVTLCQENVNGYRSAHPQFLREMVKSLGNLANFTLDIKQCIRSGYSVTEISNAMDFKIKHIHISDHSPTADCLLPLNGDFNFTEFFNLFKEKGYDGDFIIEVYKNAYKDYSEIFKSFENLKKQSQKLFD